MTVDTERAGVLAHVEKILGITRFEHTAAALLSLAPIIAVVGGRRSGKTFASQVAAILCVFTRRNAQVLVTGPNADSIRRWIGECAALLGRSELARGAVIDLEAMRITFSNGSEIIGLPPTPGRLRGYGGRVWMIVVDEAGYCPSSVWSDVRYCLLDHQAEGAQAWLIGSPWGGDEHFFRQTWALGMDGDADVDSYQWRADMNPLLPPGWLARERDRINVLEAAGELDGEWIGDGAQFYPRALLDRCVADIELPALRELHGPARGIAAWDWGVSYDQSAVWVNFRAPVRGLNPEHDGRAVFVGYPYLYPPATPLVDVVDDAVACPSPFHYWASETNGCGSMPSQELDRRIKARGLRRGQPRAWLLTATTAAKKMAAHAMFRWLLENGQVVIPRHPQMLRQFAGMKFDTSGRSGSISAGDNAVHDDVVDAAALSMLPVSMDGRVICGMQQLAGERAVPEVPTPELDVPVVQTGAGLRVYSRPVLQSVADQRISMPAGAGPKVYRDASYDGVRVAVKAVLNHNEKE